MFKKVLIGVALLLLIPVSFLGVKNALASETSGNLTAGMQTGIVGVLMSAPIASPPAGSYTSSQSVTLTAGGSIAIYYTTDGTTPTCSTGIKYTTAISVTSTTTIKSIACYGSGLSGPVASDTYTITEEEGGAPAAAGGAPAAEALPGTTDVRGKVSSAGVFLEPITATSEDELCTLTIHEGTVGLTADLEPLTEITILIMDEPPPPPEGANIIGLAYDFDPDGATFDPPATLSWSYDPADIPEGIAEDTLVIAYYDEVTGEWVELECVVDTENNTITASVSHFTTFSIIVAAPPTEEEEVPEEEEVVPEEEEEVPEEEEVVPEEEEEVPEEKEINWGLIGGIIGAAILVIALVTFFVVRRRAY